MMHGLFVQTTNYKKKKRIQVKGFVQPIFFKTGMCRIQVHNARGLKNSCGSAPVQYIVRDIGRIPEVKRGDLPCYGQQPCLGKDKSQLNDYTSSISSDALTKSSNNVNAV